MQILTFILNNIVFGIPVSDVSSIETTMNITPVPAAPDHVKGIVWLHEKLIPIYSLVSKFGYPDQKILNTVVIEADGVNLGLEVGEVKEILELPDKQIIPMPLIMKGTQNFFNDVASSNKKLIVLLTVENLLNEAEREELKRVIEENKNDD